MRCQARRYEKQIAELKFPKPTHSTPDKKKKKLFVSKSIWNSLSPHSKIKSKHVLSGSMSTGLNTLFRKKLGANLSNSWSFTETETSLLKDINEFTEKDDVSRVRPGLKTLITRNNENIPVRYCMSTLKPLYLKFWAEPSLSCYFSTSHKTFHKILKEEAL